MQWYYVEDGKRIGPITEPDFRSLVSSGKITPKTLVWSAGMADWIPCEKLPKPAEGDAQAAAAPAGQEETGVCRECGKTFALQDMITYEGATICAECKPTFFQRVQEGAQIPGEMVYATFWIRFCAKFVDGIILNIFSFVVGLLFGISGTLVAHPISGQVLMQVILMVLVGIYDITFTWKMGATPGKMAMKLKIVRPDGSPLSFGRAAARYFAKGVSWMTLGIGFIMIAFDAEKRALHDRICDTRVIRL
jgi:uncharacterized RDD family membrane protein YckC